MSMLFYPDGWELAVDDPGHGSVLVRALANPYDAVPLVDREWSREFHGARIGEFLAAVTARALGGEPGRVGYETLPRFLTPAVARALLPSLQNAVLLALAGSDRYERVFPDRDERPAEPLCARCHLGSLYASVPTESAWCAEYGHRAFGTAVSRWENAQESFRLELERWERKQADERERRALNSGREAEALRRDADFRKLGDPGRCGTCGDPLAWSGNRRVHAWRNQLGLPERGPYEHEAVASDPSGRLPEDPSTDRAV